MPYRNLECIVLKSRNFKDADKIFTLYSRSEGKISAVARGVRKIKSRRAGNLDTLNHVSIGIHEKDTTKHKTINEARVSESFRDIKKDLDLSKKAYYIIGLLDRFVEEEHSNEELFDLLLTTLKDFAKENSVSDFERKFLKMLGYGSPDSPREFIKENLGRLPADKLFV